MKAKASAALLPVRLVVGWMFLSAFHRRVLLAPAKLDPEVSGYLGEKFNQFMPGAILGVDDLIAALLDRPGALQAFLVTFTIIEGLVGLALILGLGTRLAAFGVLALSAGILFGSGWLGPTCLDEWQIGSLGIAGGATLMLTGGGSVSLDSWIAKRFPGFAGKRWFRWLADPAPRAPRMLAGALAAGAILVTLATNQVFHGGLWGTLHNDSVRPRVDVLAAALDAGGDLELTVTRPVGPETYGAFIVDLRVLDLEGEVLRSYDGAALAGLKEGDIQNRWLVRVRTTPHGLLVPLGAEATVRLPALPGEPLPEGKLRVVLHDVSGVAWEHTVDVAAARALVPQASLAGGEAGGAG